MHLRAYLTTFPSILTQYSKTSLQLVGFIVLSKLLMLIWRSWVAREDVELLGRIEVGFNLISILLPFVLLGFHYSLVRFKAIHRAQERSHNPYQYFKVAVISNVVMSLLLGGIYLLIPSVLEKIFTLQLGAISFWQVMSALVTGSLLELGAAYLMAELRIAAYGFVKYLLPVSVRFLLFWWLKPYFLQSDGFIILFFALIYGFSFLAALGLMKINVRKLMSPIAKTDWSTFLSYSAPISIAFIAYSLYQHLDVLVLSHFVPLSIIGIFSVLVSVVNILDLIFSPVLQQFHAYLGRYSHQPRQGIGIMISIAAGSSLLGLCLIFGLTVGSYWFLPQFFNIPSADWTQIILYLGLIKIIQDGVVSFIRQWLDFYGFIYLTLGLMVLALVGKSMAFYWLVPSLGIEGIILGQTIGLGLHLAGCLIGFYWKLKAPVSSL